MLNMPNKVYEVRPKSIRDQIMFELFRGKLMGIEAMTLERFSIFNGQSLHSLTLLHYVKHVGDGKFSLTDAGYKALQSRYKNMPTTSDFTMEDLTR